jgi:hypothetical protein
MRTKAILPAFAIIGIALAQPAAANVVYNFFGNVSGAVNAPINPRLVVTDAAFASGSLNFTVTSPSVGLGCGPSGHPSTCTITGDDSGFVSLFNGSFDPVTQSGYESKFSIDVNFAPDGTLGGSIDENGLNQDLAIAGSEFSWSGSLSSDLYPSCDAGTPNGQCKVAGYYLADLPEPLTLSLFGVGVLGVHLARSRPRKMQNV